MGKRLWGHLRPRSDVSDLKKLALSENRSSPITPFRISQLFRDHWQFPASQHQIPCSANINSLFSSKEIPASHLGNFSGILLDLRRIKHGCCAANRGEKSIVFPVSREKVSVNGRAQSSQQISAAVRVQLMHRKHGADWHCTNRDPRKLKSLNASGKYPGRAETERVNQSLRKKLHVGSGLRVNGSGN